MKEGRGLLEQNPPNISDMKKKGRRLADEVADKVHELWLSPDVSRPLPIKKRVKCGVPTHLLECSYTEAYNRFKAENPTTKIGYVKLNTAKTKQRKTHESG